MPPPVAAPVPLPAPIPQYVPLAVAFTADRTTIARGQCVTVRWNVSNIKAVYLRGPDAQGEWEHWVEEQPRELPGRSA